MKGLIVGGMGVEMMEDDQMLEIAGLARLWVWHGEGRI
jgi:hypothetical protein